MPNYRISSLSLTDEAIVITLADGQILIDPFSRDAPLKKATLAERELWQFADDGHGLNWPQLWASETDEPLVSVWEILQNKIYDAALTRLEALGWSVERLNERDRDLIALWRAEADINNGGFLQFIGNWGLPNYHTAIAALEKTGAPSAAALLRSMMVLIRNYLNDPEISTPADLLNKLSDSDSDRIDELDEAFWTYPDDLTRLVVQHFGAPPQNSQQVNY
ncbi:DUF4375 domain-containing protein [Arthrobacter sp. GMC3]|uniref:DMP19 family protein n=1 Tax=Arthrobacter sp. GMC3 TaxID=2058894 RepID=UPI000CE43147|nr:DUF4375 domain-containing protein [Arthrobacter sp. GMC3]